MPDERTMPDELCVIFENAPGPEPARFIDVENAETGESVAIGWMQWETDPERWSLGPFVRWDVAKRLADRVEDAAYEAKQLRVALQQVVWLADATEPLSVRAAEIARAALAESRTS